MEDTIQLQSPRINHMNVEECFQNQKGNSLAPIKNEYVGKAPTRRNSIEYWQSILGLEMWQVMCTPISEMQVVDDLYGDMPGNEFVGVTINNLLKIANIYHTRSLMKDDIIHELLHVRFQKWEEEEVVRWTNKFINADDPKMLLSQLKLALV